MEMPLPITIEKLVVRVKLAPDKHENLHAFGELELYSQGDAEPIFKVKGWTIRTKIFGDQKVLSVVPPAYPTGGRRFLTSFYINNKSLWHDVVKLFLDEYSQVSGGLSAQESEEIDVDEIAEGIERMEQEEQNKGL